MQTSLSLISGDVRRMRTSPSDAPSGSAGVSTSGRSSTASTDSGLSGASPYSASAAAISTCGHWLDADRSASIERRSRLPLEVADAWHRIEIDPQLDRSYLSAHSPEALIGVGLSMRAGGDK